MVLALLCVLSRLDSNGALLRPSQSLPAFRPEISERLPASIQALIRSCWSAMPSERPEMDEVMMRGSRDGHLEACPLAD